MIKTVKKIMVAIEDKAMINWGFLGNGFLALKDSITPIVTAKPPCTAKKINILRTTGWSGNIKKLAINVP